MKAELNDKEYELNHYRSKQLNNGKYMVTVDSGDWIILSKKKYGLLVKNRLKDDFFLYSILKDKHVVLTDDNKDDYVRKLRGRYSHVFSSPSLHIVAVTRRCNQSCVYCHANASPGDDKSLDMGIETAKKTVDFIFQSPNRNITIEFQGGEPLLNFEAVKYIVEYAEKLNKSHKKNLLMSLVSNLTAMDESKLEFLMKHRVGLCTSLDGPAHVHDKNRRFVDGRGTYKQTVRWINTIKKKYHYPLDALMVTTRASLPYPEEIVDEYLKHGFDQIQIRPMLNLGHAQGNMDKIGFSAEEYIGFWKKAMDHILEINGKTLVIERLSGYMLSKILHRNISNFVDLNSPCGAVISTLAYDHDGNIFSCDEGRQYDMFRLGTVDMKMTGLFESSQAQSMVRCSVNDCVLCDNCVWKPYCGICPVCNYAESGSLIPKLPISQRCRILDAMFMYLIEKIQEEKHNNVFFRWVEGKNRRL